MKKIYILGIVSLLALSLLLAGCGGTTKSGNSNMPSTKQQSQDMNNNSGDMKNMDHSKMNMDGNNK